MLPCSFSACRPLLCLRLRTAHEQSRPAENSALLRRAYETPCPARRLRRHGPAVRCRSAGEQRFVPKQRPREVPPAEPRTDGRLPRRRQELTHALQVPAHPARPLYRPISPRRRHMCRAGLIVAWNRRSSLPIPGHPRDRRLGLATPQPFRTGASPTDRNGANPTDPSVWIPVVALGRAFRAPRRHLRHRSGVRQFQ